jgi:hypothetical protein
MADALLSAICGGAGGVLAVGLLHLVRMPVRIRRGPVPPLDMSQYRVPPQE